MSVFPFSLKSIPSPTINSTGLTTTSILFNPQPKVSTWVDRMFGSQFYFKPRQKNLKRFENEYINTTVYREQDLLPQDNKLWPSCSIEVLGYVRLHEHAMLDRRNKFKSPLVGHGYISFFTNTKHDWKCYYRVSYGWFDDYKFNIDQGYWPVVFYCMAPNEHMLDESYKSRCKGIDNYLSSNTHPLTFKLSMTLRATSIKEYGKSHKELQWITTFVGHVMHLDQVYNYQESMSDLRRESKSETSPSGMGMCLVLPYLSTDSDKAAGNGAMIAEYINYYSQLGLDVFVYDRDGVHEKYFFNSTYVQTRNLDLHFHYHKFTIHGLLYQNQHGFRYDNENELHKTSVDDRELQDRDKTLTITHCRFEARALYRIEDMLVADFDEFLYCHASEPSFEAQRKFLHRDFLYRNRLQGFEQITIPQRWVQPRADSPRDCLVENARSGRSVLDCFGAYKYYKGGQGSKSIYMGYRCPVTDFHFSCTNGHYNYNCLCQSKFTMYFCSYVHLSSSKKGYDVSIVYNSTEMNSIKVTKSELSIMANT